MYNMTTNMTAALDFLSRVEETIPSTQYNALCQVLIAFRKQQMTRHEMIHKSYALLEPYPDLYKQLDAFFPPEWKPFKGFIPIVESLAPSSSSSPSSSMVEFV